MVIPLKADESGTIRVSSTRVTLESLIGYYKQGETVEDLHRGFPTVPLKDVHAVVAYYLANTEEVDAYLHEQREKGKAIRAYWEAQYPPKLTREDVMARWEAKKRGENP
jgi:uncharacterized protein (DUF433 family)